MKDDQLTLEKLDHDEREILLYLEREKTFLLDHFKNHIEKGRNGILHRFISSIIRENMMNQKDNMIKIYQEGGMWKADSSIPKSILEHLSSIDSYNSYQELALMFFKNNNSFLIIPINKEYAFGRVEICGPVTLLFKDGNRKFISHPSEILDLLLKEGWPGNPDIIEMFKRDLSNSSANLAYAYAMQSWKQTLYQGSLLEAAEKQECSYSLMEQSVIEGHPCHPGAKMRKGLTPSENFQYSAEFQNPITMAFIALHKTLASTATLKEEWNELLFLHDPRLKTTFEKTLKQYGKDTKDYYICPIHPWQLEKTIPNMFSTELKSKKLIEIPHKESLYYAGMSFRTLFPIHRAGLQPHYKLTTNVHLTGEVRTLSEQTIHNGPLMSKILSQIFTKDSLVDQKTFIPINELGGLHFLDQLDSEINQTERSENLACVVRENLYHNINKDEIPIVGSALLTSNSAEEPSVIVELIERYNKTNQFDTIEESVYSFFNQYVKNLIDGVIALLVKYGIGLEGHLQNTVAVFHPNGTPVKILIRDWEGIRVHKERITKAGYQLSSFHPKSRILTSSLQSVRNKVFYSVIQNHLGELALQLSKEISEVKEDLLWKIVKERLESIFSRIESEGTTVEQVKEDRKAFYTKKVDYKAVTTMRMLGEAHNYTYAKVSNPLSL
ncbi:IucA/IucC family protein [Bacillus spongiae]|uniref:IucA/IucC family protein n=1 Tax=Bacillus spongiae TaxID=2683610 RepID=A0ABU8H9I2_9BACI